MRDIVISIKPVYVNKILSGAKKVEFRKKPIKNTENINNVFIYSTRPDKKVRAIVKIIGVDFGDINKMYQKYKTIGGICKEDFFDYFGHKKNGYVYKIEVIKKIDLKLSDITNKKTPPQFYYYI